MRTFGFPLLFVLLWQLIAVADGVNVLLFLLGTTQFERSTFEYLAQQLALRHHNVITVKPILIPEEPRLVKPKLHLVKEKTLKNMLPSSLFKPLETVGADVPWRRSYEIDAMDEPYWRAHNHSCYKMLNSNLMDSLKKDKIDVAIVYAGNPCQLAILHVLGVPFIYYDLNGFTDETVVASETPWNLNSHASRRSPSNAFPNYVGRLLNGYHLIKETLAQESIPVIGSALSKRYRELDAPITKMFAEDYEIKKRFKNFPNVNQIKQSAELYFVNTDPLLEDGTAFPPHVVPVGGLHIDHVKPLFAPWNTTIESAEEGVIVVSLGTQADSTRMPATMAKALLGALSKLVKYRIYWRIGPNMKLDGVDLDKVPSHINTTTFIPQNDLVAHRRTKLLITNGGMASVMEALAHGVPMVGIPLYGVNYANLQKVQNKGLGVIVNKNQLTEASLLGAIKEVLENKRFAIASKDASKEFRDRSQSPFDLALHLIEHVGRHRGAKFLRSIKRRSTSTLVRSNNLDFWFCTVAIPIVAYMFVRALLGFLCQLLGQHGPPPGSAGIEVADAKTQSKATTTAATTRKESKKSK